MTAAQLDRGYVLLLPGVAKKPSSMAGIAGGLRDAGIDQAIERDLRGSRPFGGLENVQLLERNREWADEGVGPTCGSAGPRFLSGTTLPTIPIVIDSAMRNRFPLVPDSYLGPLL